MLCSSCGNDVSDAGFYPGSRQCKECVRARVKARRDANIEAIRAYDRARGQSPERKARVKADYPKYANHPSKAAWKIRNADKKAAHDAVNNAVRDGRMIRPLICEDCNQPGRIEGHHDNYLKPLAVRWLCITCHKAAHRALNEFARQRPPMQMAAE